MRCRCLVFLLLVSLSGYSQNFPYTRYSVKEGLPHSNVYAMAQDSLGYMWFGTENGLARFDGTSFVPLFSSNTDLAAGAVTTLQFSNTGVLYAGTGSNRVYKIDDNQILSVRGTGASMLSVSSLGIQNDAIIIFHEFIHTEVVPEPGTSNKESVNKIRINKSDVPYCSKSLHNGTLLIGRSEGLFKVVNGVESACEYEGYHGEPVYTIFEDSNGDIFLGSVGKIIKVQNAKVTDVIDAGFSEKKNIKVLLRDDYGNFWINFWGDDNLFVLTPGQNAVNLFENSGISRGIVSKLFKDASGNVWLSVLGDGVYRFSNLLLKNNYSDTFGQGTLFTCMDATSDRYIIFGTYNGLLFLKRSNNTFYRVKLSQGLLEYVRDIRVNGNDVYAGITDIRLDSIKVKEQRLVVASDTFKIHYKHASSIQQVEDNLYLGNWDNEIGIEHAETGKVKGALINLFKNYESLRINSLYYGRDKKLYIGSQGGLVVADLKRSVKYAIHNRVLNGSINRITKGSDPGDMIVYSEHGVCLFHNGKIETLLETSDNNQITALCETETGARFIGTNNGLYYYSQKDSAHFDYACGLPANEINDLYYDRSHQQLYVLTHSGYSVINTSQLKNYKIAQHRLLVNCIETDAQKIYFSGSVSIPYSENLKLLNLSTLNPSGVHFKYIKLEVDGKTYYTASYKFDLSELAPGKNLLSMRFVFDNGTEGPVTT
ncbi:MAG TPA: two-component regulator propeller domain-containing protein, partial [Bacteroidia bacterium]|nr:two-component regulator propeller domain-containing protein [Bacteroidia bacterium]